MTWFAIGILVAANALLWLVEHRRKRRERRVRDTLLAGVVRRAR